MYQDNLLVIDISRTVKPQPAPGKSKGAADLTCLLASEGTYVEAPAHAMSNSISDLPLSPYVGAALYVDLSPQSGGITAAKLIDALKPFKAEIVEMAAAHGRQPVLPARLVVRTCNPTTGGATKKQAYFEVDAIEYIFSQNFNLLGCDTSVDPPGKTDAKSFLETNQIFWLENLELSAVPRPGIYYLIAPPIKLSDTRTAPARAILLSQR